MTAQVIRPAAFERVEILLDVGKVLVPHRYLGKWVITLKVVPFERLEDAKEIERGLRELLARHGIKFSRAEQGRPDDAMELRLPDRIIDPADESNLACIESEDFAVLSGGDFAYIQCARASANPVAENIPLGNYLLEYQAGSEDRHFKAVDQPVTLERVMSAFRKYLHGDASFITDFQWEKMELERWNPKPEQTRVDTD
jgi:hypothetical protein